MNKKVWPEEVEGYLNNGYKLSRLPISEKARNSYIEAWVVRKQKKLNKNLK